MSEETEIFGPHLAMDILRFCGASPDSDPLEAMYSFLYENKYAIRAREADAGRFLLRRLLDNARARRMSNAANA